MTQIKVCGMTDAQNIKEISALGVDALGFILAESPRQLSLKKAEKLIRKIPPFISTVAVTVNPETKELEKIINSHLFDYIQFHGDETETLIAKSPLKNIKALGISSVSDLGKIHKYEKMSAVDFLLLDNKSGSQKGGTGSTFSWELLEEVTLNKPFILAGGLGPENIKKAVAQVNPEAVDLNSALEIKPGIKDVNLYKKTLNCLQEV